MFYILTQFLFVFVNVYSKKKSTWDYRWECSVGYARITSCSSVAACQCDVLMLCTFIMCMDVLLLAVIRVTLSHVTQRKKYATHLYEHNTVVGGQSVSIMKCYYFVYLY